MKKRITALALACVMVMGTVAAAAGVENTISVTPMDLTVNGQTVTPTKSDGTAAQVFSYDGATYAPVRYLSELMGFQVDWDKNDPDTAKLSNVGGLTYADTIAWDGQYDVVVVGFGGAGAVAAAEAADEGAKVLVLEKAPEGHEGGNTRYCAQLFAYGNEDEEATYSYFKALAADREISEAMLRVYTKNIAHMYDVMEKLTGIDKSGYVDWSDSAIWFASPEYPEFTGSEHISLNSLHDTISDSFLWQTLRKRVVDRSADIDVWFESPGTHLIQDPITKTILGVQTERDGKILNIRANNGVVLSCGGFENNPEMIECYLDMANTAYIGTGYNTGDGIYMAMEVGADLWHMDVWEGGGSTLGAISYKVEPGERGTQIIGPAYTSGSILLLTADGNRMLREDEISRHGHIYDNGTWRNPRYSQRTFVFYDQAHISAMNETLPEEIQKTVFKADTLEGLAKATGMDPQTLSDTISTYNDYVKNGKDLSYGRDPKTMTAISNEGPYYALEVLPAILNTQGGPRRNENAEIVDRTGKPIPHLYSAGELGGITAFQYQGGGNIAECIIFGQIAGKNAAAAKSDAPASLVKTASNLVYTPGKVSDIAKDGADVTLAAGEFLGVSHSGMGGDLQVKVTMQDGKIAKVEIVKHSETPGISDPAREQLPDAIVKAGSVEVDNVSGATITSKAIKEAVADALSQVK